MNVQRKNKLLKNIEDTVSKAVTDTTVSAYLLTQKKTNRFVIGKYVINKNMYNMYSISEQSGAVLYENLYCVDAVLALVECLIMNNIPALRKVLTIEHEYCKQYLNMTYMKRAIENKYSTVFEDRYELAKERLSNAQHKLRSIRKTLK